LSGSKEIPMDERKLFITFMWVAIAGAAFSLLCLAVSGAGDHPTAFQTYLLCSAIVLGSSLIALALLRGRKD
jgi:FtsH-binding integral membrane protein